MIDLMKRIMYTGVGLALNTRAEVEAWVKDMMEKGKMSEQDGREFLSDLSSRYDKARAELQSRIDEMVNTSLKKANVARRSELEDLKKEITALREELARQNSSGETPSQSHQSEC
jgi:polyhydroxyalkanoate synthesis regulator phasin